MLRGDILRDAFAANQAGNNAGSDDEGQNEAVHAVPVRSPAAGSNAGVVVVHEGEGQELADQGVLDGEQKSGPGDSRSDDTDRVALVALLTAVAGPFKTPVDGTEEGQDLRHNA